MAIKIGLLQAIINGEEKLPLEKIVPGVNSFRISFYAKADEGEESCELTLKIDDNPNVFLVENEKRYKEVDFVQEVTGEFAKYEKGIEIEIDQRQQKECMVMLLRKKKYPYSAGVTRCGLICWIG
jgi:hypothetical protein